MNVLPADKPIDVHLWERPQVLTGAQREHDGGVDGEPVRVWEDPVGWCRTGSW
jgi:hypothetical protein